MAEPQILSRVERLDCTWEAGKDIADDLGSINETVSAYSQNEVSKPYFLGAVIGFRLNIASWSDKEISFNSLNSFICARFEATKEPFSFYGGLTPCAFGALIMASEAVTEMVKLWPGLEELIKDFYQSLKRTNYSCVLNKMEEFDPAEMTEHLVSKDENFRRKTQDFPADTLALSFESAFQEMNVSHIYACAFQEYAYARNTLICSSSIKTKGTADRTQGTDLSPKDRSIISYLENKKGKPIKAAAIASYVGGPHDYCRRRLSRLQQLGFVQHLDRQGYIRSEKPI